MVTKKEFYSEVYFIDNPEYLKSKQWNNLLMAGTKNWNHYFLRFKTKQKYQSIKNVELIEFNTGKSMFSYLKKINKVLLLDFSLEHKYPCLLKFI